MSEEVGVYWRVSTEEQSIDRQRKATTNYAQKEFDVSLGEMRYYEDKSTGTNIDRDDYIEMMNDIESGELDAVAVKELSRLARSLQDLQETVDRIVSNGCELHFIEESLVFTSDTEDPFQELQLQILGAVAEFQAKMRQQSAREGLKARVESSEDYHHGPAPLGFEKDSGVLYEKQSYQTVCEILQLVKNEELSKRKAADKLDSSRATIKRCIEDRPDLYGLE